MQVCKITRNKEKLKTRNRDCKLGIRFTADLTPRHKTLLRFPDINHFAACIAIRIIAALIGLT